MHEAPSPTHRPLSVCSAADRSSPIAAQRRVSSQSLVGQRPGAPACALQRRSVSLDEDEFIQPKLASPSALLQAKADVRSSPAAAPPSNRTGLPDTLKAGVERLSGLSLDHVRVHYNSSGPAQLNALAYAQGSEIHVAPGQEKHLPHEAWHIVQQAQGRVKPTTQAKGNVPINDDSQLEKEADAMGQIASRVLPESPKVYPMVSSEFTDESQASSLPSQRTYNSEVAQLTVRDILEGQNYFSRFLDSIAVSKDAVGEYSANLRSAYQAEPKLKEVTGPALYDVESTPFVEAAAKGFKHSLKELETHSGGYLYQALLHKGLGGFAAGARQGANNKNEPDLVVKDVAVEAKKTDQEDFGRSMTEAVNQISRRQNYKSGLISILLTNYETVSNNIGGLSFPQEETTARVIGLLGQQRRAFQQADRVSQITVTIHMQFSGKLEAVYTQKFIKDGDDWKTE